MATYEEVEAALLAAIKKNADASGDSNSATNTEAAGRAARELAEAYAWLRNPAQAH